MRKCPGCGQPIESFATRCPYCGMELKSDGAASSLVKFTEKLDELEGGRVQRTTNENTVKEKKKIGFGTIVLWIFFFPIFLMYYVFKVFPFLIKTATNIYRDPDFDGTDKRKQDYIINAPIPNNREDLMEFAILCSNKIEVISYFQLLKKESAAMNAWNSIWFKKLNLIIDKAKIAMKDDRESLREIMRLRDEANEKLATNKKNIFHVLLGTGILVVVLIVLLIILYVTTNNQ